MFGAQPGIQGGGPVGGPGIGAASGGIGQLLQQLLPQIMPLLQQLQQQQQNPQTQGFGGFAPAPQQPQQGPQQQPFNPTTGVAGPVPQATALSALQQSPNATVGQQLGKRGGPGGIQVGQSVGDFLQQQAQAAAQQAPLPQVPLQQVIDRGIGGTGPQTITASQLVKPQEIGPQTVPQAAQPSPFNFGGFQAINPQMFQNQSLIRPFEGRFGV